MLEIRSLTKNYGEVKALKGISFSVNKGEILALLGPNGAGKTTTMKIITGFISQTSGEVLLDNLSIKNDMLNIQNKIGYLPENTPLYQDLNVYESLDLFAGLRGLSGIKKKKAINDIVDVCDLKKYLYFSVSEMSKGYKQRLALAQALIHNPEIIILDEPTNGLDPNQIKDIRKLIKKLSKNKIVIISTHIMQEVESIADIVVVINKGEIVEEGSIDDLMNNIEGGTKVHVTVKGTQKIIISKLQKVKGVNAVEKIQSIAKGVNVYEVISNDDVRAEINKALVKADFDVIEIKADLKSMEDVFYKLTN